MAPPRTQSGDSTNTRLGVLEYKVDELKSGQDTLLELVGKISYVHIADYTEDKKDIDKQILALRNDLQKNYITKDSQKNKDKIIMAVVIAICVAIATTVLNFILKGGLSSKQ